MYDSTNPLAIPTTAQMVAGYIDGADAAIHQAWAANWGRFPNAVKVRIAVIATTNDGHVLDVERYDALPAEAPSWVLMRRAAGMTPTVYVSLDAWPTVRQAFRDQNVAEPQYWVAYYPAAPGIPVGCVAHQYANPTTSGGDYDLSAVADVWPGVDVYGPGGGILRGKQMLFYQEQEHGFLYVVDGSGKRYVYGPEGQDWRVLLGTPKIYPAATLALIPTSVTSFSVDPGTDPSEPPEPAEPTKITLSIPAIPGTATGTLS